MNTENSIFRSLEIIEKRINEKLTVESIAADIYISKFHYMRLFREVVGDSVMDYVTKRKLSLAAKSLLESSASILEIALEYGYDSRDGFSRSFKAFMGVTPAEYRKHKDHISSQNPCKEYNNMEYSKTTDAIIGEITEWVSQANDLVRQIRQIDGRNADVFWKGVADQTEILADNSLTMLNKVNSIARNPDEITDGMELVKTIDDTAFVIHCIAFQIEMMEARIPEQNSDKLFAERYRNLAWSGIEKAMKVSEFLRELLLMVIKDMRNTVGEMINDAVKKGKDLADNIPGNLTYIREEIVQLVDVLSTTPVELMTLQMLDDSFFKMKLILITAKINIDESGCALIEKMQSFSDALNAAAGFCGTIIKPVVQPTPLLKKIELMQDIVYMENVLFFYIAGELEYLSREPEGAENSVQKADFDKITAKINDFKKTAFYAERDEDDVSVFQEIAGKLNDIASDLYHLADKLGKRGGAIKVITDEQKRLAAKTEQLIKDIEGL